MCGSECDIRSQGYSLLVFFVFLDKLLFVFEVQFVYVKSGEDFLFMNGEVK